MSSTESGNRQHKPNAPANDAHIDGLLDEALEESFPASDPIAVAEVEPPKPAHPHRQPADKGETFMTSCTADHHPDHAHQHGPNCGHKAIRHDGHVDYLHGGHLHNPHADHIDEHVIEVGTANPVQCTPASKCSGHIHGPNCGHEAIPHGDHVDYLVNGTLHHPHGDHCDLHGSVQLV